LIFTFTGASVTAIGANFSLTDLGENLVSGSFDVTLSDGTMITVNTSGGSPFRGFTTDGGNPITSLTFHPGDMAAFGTLDNLYVGQVNPVPEHGATGLAAALLCLLIAGGGIFMRAPRRVVSEKPRQ
jgi:hypothetical protein